MENKFTDNELPLQTIDKINELLLAGDYKCSPASEDLGYTLRMAKFIIKDLLRLANRQNAEIERLQTENKLLVENNISTKYPCCVLCGNAVISTKTLDDYDNLIGYGQAETARELSKLIVKEMVGEE